jgi:hypothetical protein
MNTPDAPSTWTDALARANLLLAEQLRGVSTARRAKEEESGRTLLISLAWS